MNLNEQYETYRNQTNDQLMETLMQMTAEQKASGELNASKMEEIYLLLSPMLSKAQRARMREIITRLNTPNGAN